MANEPVLFKGIMVSSTFTDLIEHRKALIAAIHGEKMMAVGMENDSAKLIDMLDSSWNMVGESSAYIGVISHKYGQIPADPKRNPENLSLTELEFRRAEELGRPILLFIMGEDHHVRKQDVEKDAEKQKKLDAFLEYAKRMSADSGVQRVYKLFNSLEEFRVAAERSVADLRRHLEQVPVRAPATEDIAFEPASEAIPVAPAFYAEPPYIGSHDFIGREAQLETLSDWASASDAHPVLLFEAIGGNGKSMLAWEWTTKHATKARSDWAGRFWYSFYERGAQMADFCRRALAYMNGQSLRVYRKKKTLELSGLLLNQLRMRPWLLVLDGLERVLVAYNRIDAAQLVDEEAGGFDEIASGDPCAAISPEDDDLLRALAGVVPSKLLLTSRLVPRVLLNASSQPIAGVLHERLPGLRPADAEKLLRACGVTGNSEEMQAYLKSHCDCHPLVTGILAGLINDYFPDRGNFDAWATAGDGGAALNLADLNLVQKRNHILLAALDALPKESRQLLSTLALLSEAVDGATLAELNPHLTPHPNVVGFPQRPEEFRRWSVISEDERSARRKAYLEDLQRHHESKRSVEEWQHSRAYLEAPGKLRESVRELERRGLLQYDRHDKRYDLHPVVRGVAAGRLRPEEARSYGQRAVDYFSRQSHHPYEYAATLEDLAVGLNLMRTLLRMGQFQEAADVLEGDLAHALVINLESHTTTLALLRPFFPHGWRISRGIRSITASYLLICAGIVLRHLGEHVEAMDAYAAALSIDITDEDIEGLKASVSNISGALYHQNRLAEAARCFLLALDIATLIDDAELFKSRLDWFDVLASTGRLSEAETFWTLIDPMGRHWPRRIYQPGNAELSYARLRYYEGSLSDEDLVRAETLARSGRNRGVLRDTHALRGEWRLRQGRWDLAAASLHEAIRMAHEVNQRNENAAAQLALANLHLGRLPNAREVAEQLSLARMPSHLDLAALWLAIGDREQAKIHALAAYKEAWADGEPYVFRFRLDHAKALLAELGVEVPNLTPHDPAKYEKFPWEGAVEAFIERLRAKKAAQEAKAKGSKGD